MGTRFREEHVLGIGRSVKQFLDAWKSTGCRKDAGFDGIAGAFKIVPGQVLYIRPEHEVGMALPGLELVLLRSADGASDDLKDVFRSAAATILNSDRNAEDTVCANLAGGDCGHLGDEATVGEAARADFDGFEKAGDCATGPNGVDKRALGKDDGIERRQVCSHDGHRNPQVLKLARGEDPVHQVGQPMIARQAEARNAPACDVAKFDVAASRQDFGEGSTASVGSSENAADACPGNVRDGNVVLLKDLQDAEMGEAAREAPAEGYADSRARFRSARRGTAADWGLRIHSTEDEVGVRPGLWEGRPELGVQKYCDRNQV